jgi:hypothetical protein
MNHGTLVKKLKTGPVEGAPREFQDFLVKLRGKYCEIVPNRMDFLNKFCPVPGIARGRSLFECF